MKLYLTPGSCSTVFYILLEELELVFEAHIVNLMAGTQNTAGISSDEPESHHPDTGTQRRYRAD